MDRCKDWIENKWKSSWLAKKNLLKVWKTTAQDHYEKGLTPCKQSIKKGSVSQDFCTVLCVWNDTYTAAAEYISFAPRLQDHHSLQI